jgi:HrpA-like RNA helicase
VVTCIQGETGCGKSSMVPQFLVRAARARGERARVLVTQPRRIAAISLARRVAGQLDGRPLGELVGYRVGHGVRVDSRRCAVRFVTVGYLLAHLSHRPAHLDRYTHVVLDEVHERSMDLDLLLLLLRRLLQAQAAAAAEAAAGAGAGGTARQTRLIIMSATLQAGMFGEYFGAPRDVIFVGLRRYPVRTVYLDGLVEAYPALRGPAGSAIAKALASFGPPASKPASQGGGSRPLTVPCAVAGPEVARPLDFTAIHLHTPRM